VTEGILTADDRVELLEGFVVAKMSRNPAHDNALSVIAAVLFRIVPSGWWVRQQSAIRLSTSRPEPDFAIARGDRSTYQTRHPSPADISLIIEVADTSLSRDRIDKARIFAGEGIREYWIVNLSDNLVEVFQEPSGPTGAPEFGRIKAHEAGQRIPWVLDGTLIAEVSVDELLS